MITLYGMSSPNVIKVVLMLEETGLRYELKQLNLMAGEQFEPWFIAMNPNSKVPVIVDEETGITVFESGAILWYLAERTGSGFLPDDLSARTTVHQWLMLQMSGLGPMCGQAFHFTMIEPGHPYPKNRYTIELARLLDVLERRLADSEYVAGENYTIADIAVWPWVRTVSRFFKDMPERPALARWFETIARRPAAVRTLQIATDLSLADRDMMGKGTDAMRDKYFGRVARQVSF